MQLTFHGAARTVTGSCHLVEARGQRILIDCGMVQGGRAVEEENAGPFGFDPASIDTVLLTHAHLDHCGRLPLLVKRGFRGRIIATAATRDLARIVMLDAAHLQEEEARRATRRAQRHGKERPEVQPLYSVIDALDAMDRFEGSVAYREAKRLGDGLRATFFDAGHILGSASILLEEETPTGSASVLFSGDIGGPGHPLLADAAPPPRADAVVMETTYGDRLHRPYKASLDEFHDAIHGTFARGGNVIIPTFALERAQEILFVLRDGVATRRLQASTQVFLDSPMAISATDVFRRHPECYGSTLAALFARGEDPFAVPGLHFTRETSESMAINRIVGGAIIMAGSGMCTGGRVRHHLKHNLYRPDAGIIFVGFAAQGTLARKIIDGARSVDLFGEEIPVRARIHTINGFSAHADQAELLAWRHAIAGVRTTFLVHGEEKAMAAFAPMVGNGRVEMPTQHQTFKV
ncbi:MBL fold metallo-hydrolase [Rhodopila sp.]|uniref:MBL fold metallo-hydrolase n=1 Tax=Rhodopila sp. TaxID=2480087 RepID=UPI002BA830E9|nr:MBL fold metallo-hydrolase [Rhodopila sp.]HVZ07122.1 MBL fold metallo-hydrolase [Rhodopila sp.]